MLVSEKDQKHIQQIVDYMPDSDMSELNVFMKRYIKDIHIGHYQMLAYLKGVKMVTRTTVNIINQNFYKYAKN